MPGAPSTNTRFQVLFDLHHKRVHAYCLRRLSVEDANEAASEVFVVAWRRESEVPAGDEALLWLYAVARNVVRNRLRSTQRQLRLKARSDSVAGVPADGPEAAMIRTEEHEEVLSAMRSLKPADRELLGLKVWEGLSNEAIGTILGVSHRAVEGRYARALRKLSRVLEREESATRHGPFSQRGDVPA